MRRYPARLIGSEITQYLRGEYPCYLSKIALEASKLSASATPAFQENLGAPLSLILPVDALRETAHISHTLGCYATQKVRLPYKTFIHINYSSRDTRTPAAKQLVKETTHTVRSFLDQHPEFPAGLLTKRMTRPTIGGIRKHISDIALAVQRREPPVKDAFLFTHDADLVSLNPFYLHNVQRTIKAHPKGEIFTSNARHASSSEMRSIPYYATMPELPNIDSVIAWYDALVYLKDGFFELGTGFSFRALMRAGGYDSDNTEGETMDLIQRVQNNGNIYYPLQVPMPGTEMVTSSRRLINRLASNTSIKQMWTGDFAPNETYRNCEFADAQDISSATRDTHIKTIIATCLPAITDNFRYQNPDLSEKAIDAKIDAAFQTLREKNDGPLEWLE